MRVHTGLIGIIVIWATAIYATSEMKKIAPEMRGYPAYAVLISILGTVSVLLCICGR